MPNPKSTIKSYPQRLAVEHVSLDLIDPNERNSRKHRMRKIRDLALNIEQTRGLNNPLAVRSKGNGRFEPIAGHARRAALLMNGETVAPVIRLDHLSPAEARAYGARSQVLRCHPKAASQADRLRAAAAGYRVPMLQHKPVLTIPPVATLEFVGEQTVGPDCSRTI